MFLLPFLLFQFSLWGFVKFSGNGLDYVSMDLDLALVDNCCKQKGEWMPNLCLPIILSWRGLNVKSGNSKSCFWKSCVVLWIPIFVVAKIVH